MSDLTKIHSRDRLRQVLQFRTMEFVVGRRRIAPTNIDWMLEYNQQVLVFGEVKYGQSTEQELKTGQRLALERMADACQQAGYRVLVVLSWHDVADCGADVEVGNTVVSRVYWEKKWLSGRGRTVRDVVGSLLQQVAS